MRLHQFSKNKQANDASLSKNVRINLQCFVLTVSPGRVDPLGADLAGVVADNEGADGESLALLVGAVVEARASRASLVACVFVCFCLTVRSLCLFLAARSL
jgi:hypothetical protein